MIHFLVFLTLVMTEALNVNCLPRNVTCVYKESSRRLVCNFRFKSNDTKDLKRKFYVHRNHSNVSSIAYVKKSGRGYCSNSSSSMCTYSRKNRELIIRTDHCESFNPYQVIIADNYILRNHTEWKIFPVRPCEYGTVNAQVKLLQNETYIGFRFEHDVHDVIVIEGKHVSIFEFWIQCRPLFPKFFANEFEKRLEIVPSPLTFKFKQIEARGLTAGTNYSCSVKSRYKKMAFCSMKNMTCVSYWHSIKPFKIQTPKSAPFGSPVFRNGMFQIINGFCYIYFLHVPKEHRNGFIRRYCCKSGNICIVNTKYLNFGIECPKLPCHLHAANDHGIGVPSTKIDVLRQTDVKSELELWSTGERNKFRMRLRLSNNLKISKCFVYICKFLKSSDHPNCISLRSYPCVDNGAIILNSTEKAAVSVTLVNNMTLPMSEWVNCSYSGKSEANDVIIREINKYGKLRTFSQGKQKFVHLEIPTALLQCQGFRQRPINDIFIKRRCRSKEDWNKKFPRPIGRNPLILEIKTFQGCDISLSTDGVDFISIIGQDNAGLIMGVVLPVVIVIVVIILLVFLCHKRYRNKMNRFRDWKRRTFGDTLKDFVLTVPDESRQYVDEDQHQVQYEGCKIYSDATYDSKYYSEQASVPGRCDNEALINSTTEDNHALDYTSQHCEMRPIEADSTHTDSKQITAMT